MKKSELILRGFIYAVGVLAYTAAISWLLFNGQIFFGHAAGFLLPLLMLLLFVISAAITGSLVLAKPIMLYLSGHKKDAGIMLCATLSWLVLFTGLIMLSLALIKS